MSDSWAKTGMNGAFTVFFKTESQRVPSNQGCFFTYSAPLNPSLFFGFFMSRPARRDCSLGEIYDQLTKYIFRNFGLLAANVFKKFISVLTLEGRVSSDHLHNEAPEAPIIDHDAVPRFLNNFRCEILRRAADRHCRLVVVGEHLGESKIRQFDVAFLID